jgi:hypothetical protein
MPPWSPLYRRHQRTLNSPPSEPPSDALRADTDNVKPILAASEPPPEDTRAVIDQPGDSPEIPGTTTVTLDNVRREWDD